MPSPTIPCSDAAPHLLASIFHNPNGPTAHSLRHVPSRFFTRLLRQMGTVGTILPSPYHTAPAVLLDDEL